MLGLSQIPPMLCGTRVAVVLGARQVLLAVHADRLRPRMTIPPAVSLREQILAECGQETGSCQRENADTLVS